MERLLFLDFDGVLHPAGGKPGKSLPFEWLPEAATLLSRATDVGIVVHSSWSERFALDELREFLGPLGDRLIGAVGTGPKAGAILQFVQATPQLHDWLVVDDDQSQFPDDFPGKLVICDPTRGLTDPLVQDQIRCWLSASPLDGRHVG